MDSLYVIARNNTVETTTVYCDASDIQVDSFRLTAFVHGYAESAAISDDQHQNLIYLPKKVYDTVLYLLGVRN